MGVEHVITENIGNERHDEGVLRCLLGLQSVAIIMQLPGDILQRRFDTHIGYLLCQSGTVVDVKTPTVCQVRKSCKQNATHKEAHPTPDHCGGQSQESPRVGRVHRPTRFPYALDRWVCRGYRPHSLQTMTSPSGDPLPLVDFYEPQIAGDHSYPRLS